MVLKKLFQEKATTFFIFSGISEENFTKLIQHAQIPNTDRDMITNLALLGCNVVVDVSIVLPFASNCFILFLLLLKYFLGNGSLKAKK